MKLLLTSGGVTNPTIREALVEMLGKPVEESDALVIPTAQWGHPCAHRRALGEPSLPTLREGRRSRGSAGDRSGCWNSPRCRASTAIAGCPGSGRRTRCSSTAARRFSSLTGCGNPASPISSSLTDTVWVGVSAGSMVLTPRIGAQFVEWRPDAGDETLGLVDFSIFPHLDYPGWESNTLDRAHRWAEGIDRPAYALDDQSAISVVDGVTHVLSEGTWVDLRA